MVQRPKLVLRTVTEHHDKLCWFIPPELRDEVIDQLQTDRAALKACSLTCRAWLSRARYHLFRTVLIDPGHSGNAFRRLMQSSPNITTYIQELEVSGVPAICTWWNTSIAWPTLHQTRRHRDESDVDETAWLQQTLPPTTPLVKLRSLRLSAVPISGGSLDALRPHVTHLTILSLDGCRAPAFADLVRLFNTFPCLETLRLLAVQWLPGNSSPSETSHRSSMRLKRLEMSRKIDVAPLISWMLSESVHTEIISLSCSVSGQKGAFAIRDLLHAIGATLQHLKIGFQETRDPTDVLQITHFDLAQSSGLRHLHICCSAVAPALTHSSHLPSLSWIIILLSTANSPHLKEITFSLRLADLRVLNLEGLDVVLSHARFGSLMTVTFEIELHRESPADFNPDSVRRRMTVLSKKGIIRFSAYNLSNMIAGCQ